MSKLMRIARAPEGSDSSEGVRVQSTPCDVLESPDEFRVVANMPGVHQEDVDVRIDRARLELRGERRTDADDESRNLVYARSFRVPESVDTEAVSASMRDGRLTVTLPKVPQARVRRIAVGAG